MADIQERKGILTLKGNPVTVLGPELKVGDGAPAFTVYKGLGAAVESGEFDGKTRFISVVPSLDTGICDAQTKRFNDEAAKAAGVAWLTISVDTPMAQGRWCGAAGAQNIKVLSDYMDHSFGLAFGVYVKELGVLQRSIFIIGPDNKVKYVQRVPEIAQHPDYDAALAELKKVAG